MDEKPAPLLVRRRLPGFKVGVVGLIVPVLVVSLLAGGYVWARKEVTIRVDGERKVVHTLAGNVSALLEEKGIDLGEADLVEPAPDTPLEDGMEIVVRRAQPVQVKVDGETRELLSAQPTVALVLAEAGIDMGPLDRVEPDPNTPLFPGVGIEVIRVREERVTTQVALPYQVQRRSDDSLLRGQSRIIQKGEEGLVERVIQATYENGKKVKEEVLAERVIKEPVPQIVAVGTISTITRGGERIRFREMRIMEATAYSPDRRSTGKYADGYTATGIKAQRGVAAVDPRVIPLGTRLYVDGYGYAIAADVGSAVKGNIIDLCFDTHEEAVRFGRRKVKVYILE